MAGKGPLGLGDPCLGGDLLARKALGNALAQAPFAAWPGALVGGALGPGGPCPGGPLPRGPLAGGGPWPGRALDPKTLAPLAGGALGPKARGALGPGGPWPGPLARGALGPGSRWALGLARGLGRGGGGGPTNPEPKTLNRPPEAKGYDLGLYFSYAKGGLGAGHPLAEY